jgi:hypothetical protein
MLSIPMQSVHASPLPSKGDIVTISYEVNARRTLPVNPEIRRVRTDVIWEDVLASHRNEENYLNGMSYCCVQFGYLFYQ